MPAADPPIFLLGATAAGKSEAALALARSWRAAGRGEAAILSLDAMQVYRGAEIGTGKPSPAERAEFPHGGLDLADFGARFDTAQYVEQALAFLREQAAAGRRVIAAGGTGLYFRALTRGLCEAPPDPPELRTELEKLAAPELRERLGRVDPAMLARIDAANPRRLARAIAVMEATGRSLADWQAATPEPPVRDFRAFWLQREPRELEARIAARVEAMFARGWLDEARGLAARHGWEAVRAFPGIGYREIAEALGLNLLDPAKPPADEVLARLKRDIWVATRRYAKRQLTWFRREPTLQPLMLKGPRPLSALAELPSL